MDYYKFNGKNVQFANYLEPIRDFGDIIDTSVLYHNVFEIAMVDSHIVLRGEYSKNYCVNSRDSFDYITIEFEGDGTVVIERNTCNDESVLRELYDTHWHPGKDHKKIFYELLEKKFEFKY